MQTNIRKVGLTVLVLVIYLSATGFGLSNPFERLTKAVIEKGKKAFGLHLDDPKYYAGLKADELKKAIQDKKNGQKFFTVYEKELAKVKSGQPSALIEAIKKHATSCGTNACSPFQIADVRKKYLESQHTIFDTSTKFKSFNDGLFQYDGISFNVNEHPDLLQKAVVKDGSVRLIGNSKSVVPSGYHLEVIGDVKTTKEGKLSADSVKVAMRFSDSDEPLKIEAKKITSDVTITSKDGFFTAQIIQRKLTAECNECDVTGSRSNHLGTIKGVDDAKASMLIQDTFFPTIQMVGPGELVLNEEAKGQSAGDISDDLKQDICSGDSCQPKENWRVKTTQTSEEGLQIVQFGACSKGADCIDFSHGVTINAHKSSLEMEIAKNKEGETYNVFAGEGQEVILVSDTQPTIKVLEGTKGIVRWQKKDADGAIVSDVRLDHNGITVKATATALPPGSKLQPEYPEGTVITYKLNTKDNTVTAEVTDESGPTRVGTIHTDTTAHPDGAGKPRSLAALSPADLNLKVELAKQRILDEITKIGQELEDAVNKQIQESLPTKTAERAIESSTRTQDFTSLSYGDGFQVADGFRKTKALVAAEQRKVAELQRHLALQGHYKGAIDGKYGDLTKAGVESLKAQYGSVNVNVAVAKQKQETHKIVLSIQATSPDTVLTRGNHGRFPTAFKNFQTALKTAGFYDGEVDGKWGPKMDRAVSNFQRKYNLRRDRIIGKDTKRALLAHLNARTNSPTAIAAREVSESGSG